jgi:hypothetical protein
MYLSKAAAFKPEMRNQQPEILIPSVAAHELYVNKDAEYRQCGGIDILSPARGIVPPNVEIGEAALLALSR